jgi:HlyD family secretion protein
MKCKFFLLLILSAMSACEPVQDVKVDLRTAAVDTRNIAVIVESAGVIQPFRTIEVKSKASGEILSMHTDSGDVVEEGNLLVQIDKRVPRNQLALAESKHEAALARQAIAKAQLARSERLFKSRSINEVDYENSVLELANSKTGVVTSKVSIENAQFALDDTDVKAPISGTVIEKLVEKGQVISSPSMDVGGGTILMKMADLSRVQVQALVNEIDIGRIQKGQPVTVNVTSFPNEPFEGEVLKVEPQALPDQAVTSFPVLIVLDNANGLLRPGMNADVEIFVEQRIEVAAVPATALRTSRDIGTTADLVGLNEADLRRMLQESQSGWISRETAVQSGEGENGNPGGSNQYDQFWVMVVDNDSYKPVFVDTGITDHDYVEVLDGLKIGREVLLLPSSGMIRRQNRNKEQISRMMRIAGMLKRGE